jgi:predicted MFS family arabinose efflux permease
MHLQFSRGMRAYTVGLLTFIWTANYLDRQVLAILLEPIKLEMALSDTQLGLLSGLAFSLFYATLGLPIAYLADRYNRKRIIIAALSLFSVMTYACGLAQNYAQLLLARIGVGIGEAGTNPPSVAIIADLYETDARATPMAIFAIGVNLGIFLAFFFGGWLAMNYGWRVTFQFVAVPGLLLALLAAFTMREPSRGLADGCQAAASAASLATVAHFMLSSPTIRHMLTATTLVIAVTYGSITWIPAYLIRVHGMDTVTIGQALALIAGLGGGLATAACGVLADRMGKRDIRWNMWLLAAIAAIATPFFVATFNASSGPWALVFMLPSISLAAVYLGPVLAMLQALVQPGMRAQATALMIFVNNFVGLGLGPLAVGVISDRLSPAYGERSLAIALTLLSFLSLWAALHYLVSARALAVECAMQK